MILKINETIYNSIPNGFLTVQIFDKDNFPLVGANTSLLVNPMSIHLWGSNFANTNIEVKIVNIQNDPIDICFETIPKYISAFKCIYWEEGN